MAKVLLYGKLGDTFQKEWCLSVATPKEAIKAIDVNTGGNFSNYLHTSVRMQKIGYDFIVDGQKIKSKEDMVLLNHKLTEESVIKVIPIVGGSGTITVQIILTVVSIALQVASMLMAPSPQLSYGNSDSESARKDSYLFSGQNSTARQGQVVPVGYGRMMIPPMALSLLYIYRQTSGTIQPSTGGDTDGSARNEASTFSRPYTLGNRSKVYFNG